MSNLSMAAMIKAAVYFGHRKSFLCPAMKPMIYSIHDGMHIINLEKTMPLFKEALEFVDKLIYNQGEILIVGTKRAAQPLVKKYASECGMPYIDKRWLGGTLTNFKTIKKSVKRLSDLTDMIENGLPENLTKKEKLSIMREQGKLSASLGGIKDMTSLPDALFVIDIGAEKIAVAEAKRLGIPVIGIVDTNCSPLDVDFPIPGNDDARRAIDLYLSTLTDVIATSKTRIEGELAIAAAASEKDKVKTYTKKAASKPAAKPVAKKEEASKPEETKVAAPKVVKKTKVAAEEKAPAEKPEAKKPAATKAPAEKEPAAKVATKVTAAKKPAAKAAAEKKPATKATATKKPAAKETTKSMEISAKLVMQLRQKTNVGMMECKKALKEANGDIELAAELLLKSGAAKASKKSDRVANEGLLFVATAADGMSAAMAEINCETDFVAKADAFVEFGNSVANLVLEHGATTAEEINALVAESGRTVTDMCNILVGQLGENIQVRRGICLKADSGKVVSYSHGGKIASLVHIEDDNTDVAKDVAMHIAALKPLALRPEGVNAEAVAKEEEIFKAQVAESGKPAEIMDKIIAGKMQKFLADNSLYGQIFVKDSKKPVSQYLSENKTNVTAFVFYEIGMSGNNEIISA